MEGSARPHRPWHGPALWRRLRWTRLDRRGPQVHRRAERVGRPPSGAAFHYFDTTGGTWTARATSPTIHYTHLEMKEAIEDFTKARLFYAAGELGGTDVYPDGIRIQHGPQ